MAIDPQTVRRTDDDFYRAHPEMVGRSGRRIPISPLNPAHREYVREWNERYRQNSGAPKPKPAPGADKKVGAVKETCPDQKKPCCFRKLVIACDHTKGSKEIGSKPRSYKLVLPPAPNNTKPLEYHVLAGETEADKITVEMDADSCHHGVQNWPLAVAMVDGKRNENRKEVRFDAVCPKLSVREKWMSWLWPLGQQCKEYPVFVEACEGTANTAAVVKAYPDVQWEVNLAVNFGGKGQSGGVERENRKNAKVTETKKRSAPMPAFGVKLTYNGKSYELTREFSRTIESTVEVVKSIKELSETVAPILRAGNVEVSIEYPNVGLVYTFKPVEIEDDYGLDWAYSLTLKADPLIAVQVETDILDWVLTIAGGGALGRLLTEIKRRAKEGFGKKGKGASVRIDVGIKLRARGEIAGELNWEKQARKKIHEATKDGKIECSIPVTIEGVAEAEAEWFVFSAGAGVKAGGKTAIGAKIHAGQEDVAPHRLYGQGQLFWQGIKVYYCAYAYGSVKIAAPPEDDVNVEDEDKRQMKMEQECEIVPPHYWPEEPGKMYLWK
jgi:hypothetical protein